jgi:hypothetical protein
MGQTGPKTPSATTHSLFTAYLSRILLTRGVVREGWIGFYHDFYHDQLKLALSKGVSEAPEGLSLVAG